MSTLNNVDKLLQDFDIEQLTQIQSSVKQQIESKREELRQMVGRRYRDVLEASNTIKRLTEITGELAAILEENSRKKVQNEGAGKEGGQQQIHRARSHDAKQRLMLLTNLMQMLFASDDLLSRAYSVCIADRLCRTLASEFHDHFDQHSSQLFSDQLLHARIELIDELEEQLGTDQQWQCMAANLIAYTLLKPQSTISELLVLFLQSRTNAAVASLRSENSTLIGLIRSMKETVQYADQLFGNGEGLVSAFQCVAGQGWCPESFGQLLESQPLGTCRLLEAEIARLNNSCAARQVSLPGWQEVQQQCSDSVVKMCEIAGERVRSMCTHFENVDQIVEFAVAVSQIFESDWSTVFKSNSLIYRQLFGSALLDRFHQLIDRELDRLEQDLRAKLPQTKCAPPPIFHKRTVKFDALLASGVSNELNGLVQNLSIDLRRLHQNVIKYTQIGQEEAQQVDEQPQSVFADRVLAFVDRLTNFATWNLLSESSSSSTETDNASTDRRHGWLTLFRLLLALVQQEPSVLCQCMNRNMDKIVRCNRTLHNAIEQALCHFMDLVIDDCARTSNIHNVMLDCCNAGWQGYLDLVQEPERVQLSETAILDVPTQLSRHLFLFLTNIYRVVNQHSLGHLFTRNVTLHVSQRIGSLLSILLLQCAENSAAPLIPQMSIQLLFDSRTLFLMFPEQRFIKCAQLLEASLEPVELSVMQEPLGRNTKLFAQRTTMLFGQLQAEPLAALRDNQLLPSYTQLIDVIPKEADVQRLTQIPRLSKLKEESQKAGTSIDGKMSKNQRKKTHSPSPAGGMGLPPVKGVATASFTSLYDKISTGWFKS